MPSPKQQNHTAVVLRMQAVREIRFARDSKKLLKNQAKQIATAYKQQGHGAAETVINVGYGEWKRLLIAHYTVIIKEFADYQAKLFGSKANFQHLVQGFIARQAVEKARYLTHTTKVDLAAVISKGQADGLGVEDIARNIVSKMAGGIADSRARTIARTETHMAAGFGMHAQASEVSFPVLKTWIAVEDDRTRETHTEADGQQVGKDDYFDVGDDRLLYPGDPDGSAEEIINCRCTVIYEPQGSIFTENEV